MAELAADGELSPCAVRYALRQPKQPRRKQQQKHSKKRKQPQQQMGPRRSDRLLNRETQVRYRGRDSGLKVVAKTCEGNE